MAENTIRILDGSTFVVSDRRGDIEAAPDEPLGLFHADTRHLSRWVLAIDGVRPNVLSTDDIEYYFAQFFLAPATGTIYRNPYLSVIRRRYVGNGFVEEIRLLNHSTEPVELEVQLTAAADFADLFEVKDKLAKKGATYLRIDNDDLVLGYKRADFVRETRVRASERPTHRDEGVSTWRIRIEPKGQWEVDLEVRPIIGTTELTPKYQAERRTPRPSLRVGLEDWMEGLPRLASSPDLVRLIVERSVVDIAALRFHPWVLPDHSLPAAGLPWFMALFGRDSIIASYQMLPWSAELAATTLTALAKLQGTKVDRFRDEEPGKILHELRHGELTAFQERPQSPYYGTVDATPLYLVLLDEYERWTGDAALVRTLEPAARAALEWIDRFGDRDGDGYVEYERGAPTGLLNQCWKDSGNSMLFADGTVATGPIAVCEVQGYVYDAKIRTARLARAFWGDPALADRLDREAADLKSRFNRDFWIRERGFYALALDGAKRKVDSLTSNNGHLLWSGIVDDDKARSVMSHLMGDKMFSGWGVRTMASGEAGYNPIEYHNGTVWPHDNAFIAAGLARYGFRAEASHLVGVMLWAATYFRNRLPEVFGGYRADATVTPVEYPTASSPQAWAAGAPLLGLRVVLGLEPRGEVLTSSPVLPNTIGHLRMEGIPGRWGRTTVSAEQAGAPTDAEIPALLLKRRRLLAKMPS